MDNKILKFGNDQKEFLDNPSTLLRILECLQFHSKAINALNKSNNEIARDLAMDLKDNVTNLKRLYEVYLANIVTNKLNGNLNSEDLKSHELFTTTINELFKQLLST